ncbi:MAG: BMP family ABC transporter substrate-binding protein [Firmicutes bacterium]|nr:BMP family ABC transporter substrate-binding protein [Bacillota bacterium]
MTRFVSILVASLLLIMSFGASALAKTPRVVLVVERLGDRSFADSAWAGMQRAQKELRGKVIAKVVEAPELTAAEEQMAAFAKDGWDLIITLGFGYVDTFKKLAPKYPNSKFLIIDAEIPGIPNVKSVLFREHEGSFLVGALAGLMTKTNNVGFIGGMDIPLIHRFQGGFEQGVKYVNPKAKIQSYYVGAWNDAAKGKELTSVEISRGADIIYAAAGGSGAGMIQAAQEKGKYGIGVDSDQCYLAPKNMIGSMVKRVDNAVFYTIFDLVNGKFKATTENLGIKEEGVGWCGLPPVSDKVALQHVPKDVVEKLAQIQKDIVSGKIKVEDWMTR